MSESASPYRVTVFQNGQVLKSLTFDSNVITIGRTPDCEVQIEDSSISRQQAELLRTSQGFALYAHETQNVTLVRGEVVAAGDTVSLLPGDPIHLARSFDIKLELVGEGSPPPKGPGATRSRRPSAVRRPSRVGPAPTPEKTPIRPDNSARGGPPPNQPRHRPSGFQRRPSGVNPRRDSRTGTRELTADRQSTRRRRNLPPRPGSITPTPPGTPLNNPGAASQTSQFRSLPPRSPGPGLTPRPPGSRLPPPAGPVTPRPPGTALPPSAGPVTPRPSGASPTLRSRSLPPKPPASPPPAEEPVTPETFTLEPELEPAETVDKFAASVALGATHGAPVPIPPPVEVEVVPSARRRDGQPGAWLVCHVNGSDQVLGVHDDFYIGGGEDSDLRLNGAYAPRRAAILVCVGGDHRIYNTSPLPETVIVNGRGIQGFAVLVDGDEIQVYGATLSFEKNPGLIP